MLKATGIGIKNVKPITFRELFWDQRLGWSLSRWIRVKPSDWRSHSTSTIVGSIYPESTNWHFPIWRNQMTKRYVLFFPVSTHIVRDLISLAFKYKNGQKWLAIRRLLLSSSDGLQIAEIDTGEDYGEDADFTFQLIMLLGLDWFVKIFLNRVLGLLHSCFT